MKIYSTLVSIIIVYYAIVIFLLSSTAYARSNLRSIKWISLFFVDLGEERELDDPTPTDNDGGDDSSVSASPSGGSGGDTPTGFGLFTFTAGGYSHVVTNNKAVGYKSDSEFKSYAVILSGSSEEVTYTLTADFYCDGSVAGGTPCTGKTGECTTITFKIKKSTDDKTLVFVTTPTEYAEGSLKIPTAEEITSANGALGKYSASKNCKKVDDHNLPTETQIKFTITGKGEVHVLNDKAVRKSGDEYTYYEVARNTNNNDGTKLTFKPSNQCAGTDLPQSYYSCSEGKTCEEISEVTIIYNKATPSVSFGVTAPEGYTALAVDTVFNIELYQDNKQCKVNSVPQEKSIKFAGNDEVIIITKNSKALKYKTSSEMEYTYYNGVSNVAGSLGGSKFTLTGGYTCNSGQTSDCTAGTTDCTTITLEVNYYIDASDNTEHFKIVVPEGLSSVEVKVANDADLQLVEDRKNKDFCTSGSSGDNSYPEPLNDEVVKTFPKDEIYRVLAKDRHYIIKENGFQYSTKLTRKTEGNNNFTTITVSEENLNIDNIFKSETGYFKEAFEGNLQTEFGCSEPKSFASIAWCEKNCNNRTGVLEKLKSDISENIEEELSLNLTVKNGTKEVYLYKSESSFGNFFGNITESFTAAMEDIGFSVIPTILFSIIFIFLL